MAAMARLTATICCGAAAYRPLTTAPRWSLAPRARVAAAASGGPHSPAPASAVPFAGPETRETIFAVSSGAGVRAGVAVIRVSGAGARLALERMTARGRSDPSLGWLVPRMATLTKVLSPSSDERLDSALVLWFPAPRSFTGEDVAELHVHGGPAVVSAVLAALGTLPGHRLAERGEFTRRAFGNGRMDLTEVEGLSDLLAANTDAQRRQALAQMGGLARARFESWRAQILDCLAHTEAVIDFGEDADDLGSDVLAAVSPRVRQLAQQMGEALADARRGELLRDGPRVVIVGAPNAGKVRAAGRSGGPPAPPRDPLTWALEHAPSPRAPYLPQSSLLNRLAQRPAAIVTPIAGTTRDILEVELELGGYPLRLCDTAGLRSAAEADEIEVEGMRRARALLRESPMRMVVADVSAGRAPTLAELARLLGEGDSDDGDDSIARLLSDQSLLVVLNKVDALPAGAAEPRVVGLANDAAQYCISCETGAGLDALLGGLEAKVRELLDGGDGAETALVTRARHREHLEQAVGALERFERLDGLMVDLAAEELRIAAQEVGKVTGRIHVEEMLDIIFRDFCVGK